RLRSLAWRRLGLARWRLASRLGLGRSALLCCSRRLRLWRLLCAPAGPDPLGTPVAADQPLLLSPTAPSQIHFRGTVPPCGTFQERPQRSPRRGLLFEQIRRIHTIFTRMPDA